jgi:hypothetical protein
MLDLKNPLLDSMILKNEHLAFSAKKVASS